MILHFLLPTFRFIQSLFLRCYFVPLLLEVLLRLVVVFDHVIHRFNLLLVRVTPLPLHLVLPAIRTLQIPLQLVERDVAECKEKDGDRSETSVVEKLRADVSLPEEVLANVVSEESKYKAELARPQLVLNIRYDFLLFQVVIPVLLPEGVTLPVPVHLMVDSFDQLALFEALVEYFLYLFPVLLALLTPARIASFPELYDFLRPLRVFFQR